MTEKSRKAQNEARRTAGTQHAIRALSVYAVKRMAIGIGLAGENGTAYDAAIAGGVKIDGRDPTPEQLDELAEKARGDEYAAYREGRSVAAAQDLARYEGLAALSLLEHEQALSPAVRAQSLPVIHKAIMTMGGHKIAWPKIVVNNHITIVTEAK